MERKTSTEEQVVVSDTERLRKHPDVQRLIQGLALADSGFYLLEVASSEDARQILTIIQEEVPKLRGLPIDIVSYLPKTDPNYNLMDANTVTEKIGTPLRQWINDIQIPQEKDAERANLFVIDGSGIGEKDRTSLVDHFAFMNGLRDKIAGNKQGPALAVIPASLEIEKDIAKYDDLMSCCSGRFHIQTL